jgi:GNAT superfamily N-acetyltransferase
MDASQTIVIEADLARTDHQEAIIQLLNEYAMDPMGDGKPLTETARRDLIPGLRQLPTTVAFLAYHGAAPAGLAICFRGFSTFAARPLLNIHDYYVNPTYRGKGVARGLMVAIERHARAIGCCKLTLEVLENNHRAKAVYSAAGFARSVYMPEAGGALFLSKPL